MTQDDILSTLKTHLPELMNHGIEKIGIFGSITRPDFNADSDIDILVEFEEGVHVGLFLFVRLQRYLGEILGCSVDLATREALREEMKDQILKEAIHAA